MNSLQEALDALHGPVEADEPVRVKVTAQEVELPWHGHDDLADYEHEHDYATAEHFHEVEPHSHPELEEALAIATGAVESKTLVIRDRETGRVNAIVRQLDLKARFVERDDETGLVIKTSAWQPLPAEAARLAKERFDRDDLLASTEDLFG